jgi:hypothetical protein
MQATYVKHRATTSQRWSAGAHWRQQQQGRAGVQVLCWRSVLRYDVVVIIMVSHQRRVGVQQPAPSAAGSWTFIIIIIIIIIMLPIKP